MSIPFWCVLIAALLIYVAKIPVAKAMKAEGRGYDNHHPRAQQARLTGFGARAHAAHLNSIEIFPLFAAGVLMAHSADVFGWWVDVLAVLFVLSRVLYLLLYWADWHLQRSLVWGVGLLCCLLLMLSPAIRWALVSV
ncbi:MAPEG family protein [Pseudomonas cavernae]|uniref:MAPEG family protein n=1 Tax=Pseudomonas cavernae TaxID=2320867 RepID=A0A385Z6Q9_9PSED|nr:MAPEG family protein [Pseudomonas cavernae]AYC33328.1 MAPEG family protein [Pseudomonas cavernae]